MPWLTELFINEAKPALSRPSGGGSLAGIYVLKDGETIHDAPDNATLVVDPVGEDNINNIVDKVIEALPTWTGGSF